MCIFSERESFRRQRRAGRPPAAERPRGERPRERGGGFAAAPRAGRSLRAGSGRGGHGGPARSEARVQTSVSAASFGIGVTQGRPARGVRVGALSTGCARAKCPANLGCFHFSVEGETFASVIYLVHEAKLPVTKQKNEPTLCVLVLAGFCFILTTESGKYILIGKAAASSSET